MARRQCQLDGRVRGCSDARPRAGRRRRCTSSSSGRLREHVRSGRLAPGASVPSSRRWPVELGVCAGVVLEAYAQLTAEGYLHGEPGGATRVAGLTPGARAPAAAKLARRPHALSTTIRALPDLAGFPARELDALAAGGAARGAVRGPWSTAIPGAPRSCAMSSWPTSVASGAPPGTRAHTRQTAASRRPSRWCAGRCVSAASNGSRSRIRLGRAHRLIAEGAGLQPVVARRRRSRDRRVRARRLGRCEVVVVTPAHQFPTGVVLSPERRAALLEWAEDRDALIVEDDFDAELRYDQRPMGALQGLAPERVCHIGSASKRLAPGTAARVDARPLVADRRAHLREKGVGRRRAAGPRGARAGRLHRPRRARPPPAPDAPALPLARAIALMDALARLLPGARVRRDRGRAVRARCSCPGTERTPDQAPACAGWAGGPELASRRAVPARGAGARDRLREPDRAGDRAGSRGREVPARGA